MGKYLKKFELTSKYEEYINSDIALLPNVSLTNDNNIVHYNTKVPTLVDKSAGVISVQVVCRNKSAKVAYMNIVRIWKFLLKRPDLIEDINDHRWCIFDVKSGPVKLENDEKGNFLWSLSFPVTTNLY